MSLLLPVCRKRYRDVGDSILRALFFDAGAMLQGKPMHRATGKMLVFACASSDLWSKQAAHWEVEEEEEEVMP
jgi:hypothetical protein